MGNRGWNPITIRAVPLVTWLQLGIALRLKEGNEQIKLQHSCSIRGKAFGNGQADGQ
jgi:hypothetical protein